MALQIQLAKTHPFTHATLRTLARILVVSAVLAVLLGFASTQNAQAAGVVGDGTPGSCTDAEYATAMMGGGNVTFNCGADPVIIPVTTKVILAGETTTIDGNGRVTLDGQKLLQLFIVSDGAELNLRNLTLTGGASFNGSVINNAQNGVVTIYKSIITLNGKDGGGVAVQDGGALYNRGLMDIEQSTVSYNSSQRFGGGVYNTGTLTVRNSLMNNNTAIAPSGVDARGGAIFTADGSVSLSRTTLNRNEAELRGGGVYIVGGTLKTENSTIRENTAKDETGGGGGIYAGGGSVEVTFSTIARNNSDHGGNIWNSGVPFTIYSSIIAYAHDKTDTSEALECDGPSVTSLGFNIISDLSCFSPGLSSDQRDTDPLLDTIGDNGGYAPTDLPLPGSPAIDGGPTSGCPSIDSRGVTRPQGPACDVGAVEVAVIEQVNTVMLPLVRK